MFSKKLEMLRGEANECNNELKSKKQAVREIDSNIKILASGGKVESKQ